MLLSVAAGCGGGGSVVQRKPPTFAWVGALARGPGLGRSGWKRTSSNGYAARGHVPLTHGGDPADSELFRNHCFGGDVSVWAHEDRPRHPRGADDRKPFLV